MAAPAWCYSEPPAEVTEYSKRAAPQRVDLAPAQGYAEIDAFDNRFSLAEHDRRKWQGAIRRM